MFKLAPMPSFVILLYLVHTVFCASTIIGTLRSFDKSASEKYMGHRYYGSTGELLIKFKDTNFDLDKLYRFLDSKHLDYDFPFVSIIRAVGESQVYVPLVTSYYNSSTTMFSSNEGVFNLKYKNLTEITPSDQLTQNDFFKPIQVRFYENSQCQGLVKLDVDIPKPGECNATEWNQNIRSANVYNPNAFGCHLWFYNQTDCYSKPAYSYWIGSHAGLCVNNKWDLALWQDGSSLNKLDLHDEL